MDRVAKQIFLKGEPTHSYHQGNENQSHNEIPERFAIIKQRSQKTKNRVLQQSLFF